MEENSRVFDFELDSGDMAALGELTTPANLKGFLDLYRKCVNRDTPLAGSFEGVKSSITTG